MDNEKLLWNDPETEYIESPQKISIEKLARKWHLNDPNYPDNTHKLSTYTTILRNQSVNQSWKSRRKTYQKNKRRIKDLLPKQKAVLDKVDLVNQKHFDALEKALKIYDLKFERVLRIMNESSSSITSQSLKQLTAAMLDIQKGQRLATGMVTDRVGFVSEDEVKTAFRQVASILIFVFESGGVPMEVREAAMQRLEAAIDVGGDNG
jgi:hypothetical protein